MTDAAGVSAARNRHRLTPFQQAQTWRLASGLVLFAFVVTHFLNHALGHVSIEAMEAVQEVRRGFWRSPPGTLLLYGAIAIHVGLALLKLVRRRTWRVAPSEAAQVGLGLVVLLFGAMHATSTRLVNELYGLDDVYAVVLRRLWPGAALQQSILLAAVWLHAMIGFHHWLRLKTWYARWAPALLVVAVFVPTIAATGWIEGARRLDFSSAGSGVMTEEVRRASAILVDRAQTTVWALFAAVLALILGWRALDWLRRGPPIIYTGGRVVRSRPGATLLEISRMNGIPHASVCGGRGRCTTCRVLVSEGADRLPEPNRTEADALARIGAPDSVRLACQIRPEHKLHVHRLIPVKRSGQVPAEDVQAWGVERRITILFGDLRGFTSLAERLYPYDAVYLLNRYGEVMTEAIERQGGHVDKFLGDGVMALFGLQRAGSAGGRDALMAARDMLRALDGLNQEFSATLSEPLRMGIGVHIGPAVIGRIGRGRHAALTALGDSVNIASRLEGLNKDFASNIVVSQAALDDAGLSLDGAELRSVPVRGREQALPVAVAFDLESLRENQSIEAVA